MNELMQEYEAQQLAHAINADILNMPEIEADELAVCEVRALMN